MAAIAASVIEVDTTVAAAIAATAIATATTVARFKRYDIQIHWFSTLDGICWTTF